MSEAERPEAPRLRDFQEGRNPFGDSNAVAVAPTAGLVSVEQRKVMAEVQARILMARSMPRDPLRCADQIIRDCARVTLAEKALYSYARGGSDITGPSIRLAEAVAQRWGNLASGIKELSRSNGYSECVAYAWDLESGYYDERQFQVRHWRDTKGGGYAIKDERDIYELIANMGQRRKRAVLLAVMPGDVIEMATQECERTLHAKADTSPDAILKIVDAFDKIGVTRAMLEKRIQRKMEAIRPAQVVQLRKIYTSIGDEMSTVEEWFEPDVGGAWSGVEAQHAAAGAATTRPAANPPTQTRAATRKAPAKAAAAPPTEPVTKPPAEDEIPTGRWEEEAAAAKSAASPAPAGDPRETVAGSTADADPPEDADRQNAPSGGDGFEVWLLDTYGDPVGDDPYVDPMTFAVQLATLIREEPANRVSLLEQNADGIDTALAADDIAVTNILTSLRREPEIDEAQDAVMGDDADPPGVMFIQLTMDRGKPETGKYLAAFKAEVPQLVPANWNDFIELNKSEMAKVPGSTLSLCLKALRERAVQIGTEVPQDLNALLTRPAAPAAAPSNGDASKRGALSPADQSFLDNRRRQVGNIMHTDELNMLAASSAVMEFLGRVGEAGEPLKAALDKRRAELSAST